MQSTLFFIYIFACLGAYLVGIRGRLWKSVLGNLLLVLQYWGEVAHQTNRAVGACVTIIHRKLMIDCHKQNYNKSSVGIFFSIKIIESLITYAVGYKWLYIMLYIRLPYTRATAIPIWLVSDLLLAHFHLSSCNTHVLAVSYNQITSTINSNFEAFFGTTEFN